ncbi:hypothetical protein AAFF_G00302520 [Aldrovandia affinis]|uniref:DUF4806 domain-containing protein n=1 Tax=Aldrovandia affinis TaxID=143900 RepID=A0AAD7R8W9_9TELE|nr:hypothetical protein AAFF_G00302520 [Aldrovandia affinis]
MPENLNEQLDKDLSTCRWFSIQCDESVDSSSTAQLMVFIRMVFADFSTKGELLTLIPLRTTTRGVGIYNAIKTFFVEKKVPLEKLVSKRQRLESQGSKSPPRVGEERWEAVDRAYTTDQAFQKKILTILVDIREEVRRIARAEPASSASHVERLETVDDFQREEQRLSDSEAFNALVLQLSRVGGKDLKDCVHKVLDRLFSNALLAKFNMKGKGNKGKLALEKTRCFGAVQAAVMKFNAEATEEAIRQHAGDHIKHAPARRGGGGHSNTRESRD